MDVSKFGKRKYNKRRYKDFHWVFGGVERGPGNAFMVEVPNRIAQTFLPIIQKYCYQTVMSDEWRAYQQITMLGMSYQKVNHSINFINPSSGAHTQLIE